MENYFQMNLSKQQIDAISNLGLAHMGDCVFEILCRGYLCAKGETTVDRLHRDTIAMVKATAQAKFVDKLLPFLTEEELAYYRRGKNAHVHAVPKSATPAEYAKATGLEALFGALYLAGRTERINELFKAAAYIDRKHVRCVRRRWNQHHMQQIAHRQFLSVLEISNGSAAAEQLLEPIRINRYDLVEVFAVFHNDVRRHQLCQRGGVALYIGIF